MEYNKKPGKPAVIKAIKDPAIPRDDLYKSGTIHTSQGEPPNSVSRPTPKAKQVAARPITTGKLLKAGGPNGQPSKFAHRPAASSRPTPQARPLPSGNQSAKSFTPPNPAAFLAAQIHSKSQASAVPNGIAGHTRNESGSRPPPPPPPMAPPPATIKVDLYRVLYDFSGQTASELNIVKDELVEVLKKEANGILLFPFSLPFFPALTHTNIAQRLVAREENPFIPRRLGAHRIS